MKADCTSAIKITPLDELLGGSLSSPDKTGNQKEQIIRIPLESMYDFAEHPFRVLEDAKMAESVESIRQYGVLVPGIVRPHKSIPGGYEIIAGHRRRRASQLAGLKDMPVICKDLSDDEATVIMVDSNIQREDLQPSEKAKAYRMKYEALKHIGKLQGEKRSDQVLAKQMGESRNTIQRYIRLTYLVPELLELVDVGKLPVTVAYDLSYIQPVNQKQLTALMQELKVIPSGAQAEQLHQFASAKEQCLTQEVMRYVLERKEDSSKVSLPAKKIRGYFPESYTGEQIQEVIYSLLEEWKNKSRNTI